MIVSWIEHEKNANTLWDAATLLLQKGSVEEVKRAQVIAILASTSAQLAILRHNEVNK